MKMDRRRSCCVEARRQLIYYQCYEMSSHILPKPAPNLAAVRQVVDHYEKLSGKRRTTVRNDYITLVCQYLSARLNLTFAVCKGDTQPRLESKN